MVLFSRCYLCVGVQVSEELVVKVLFPRCDLCVGVQVSEELVVKVLFSRCDQCVGVQVSEELVVKVLAVDKGYPPLSGSATVFITLEDVNDMAPRFSDRDYSFSVAEDARVGSYVGIVAAVDDDHGRNADIDFLPAPSPEGGRSAFIITREGVVSARGVTGQLVRSLAH